MSAAGQAKQQKNPGAVVACIKQLDWMTGLGIIQLLDNESHEGGDSGLLFACIDKRERVARTSMKKGQDSNTICAIKFLGEMPLFRMCLQRVGSSSQ